MFTDKRKSIIFAKESRNKAKAEQKMSVMKVKIPINKGLPMLADRIKLKYVAHELGKSAAWLTNKLNCDITTTTSRGFTQADVDLVNRVVAEIGTKLLATKISLCEPVCHEAEIAEKPTVAQLKELSVRVRMPFIYETKLRKTASWYKNRMTYPDKYHFKAEDVTRINLAVREVADWLLSVEFVL